VIDHSAVNEKVYTKVYSPQTEAEPNATHAQHIAMPDAATWRTLDAATQAALVGLYPEAVGAIVHQIEREDDAAGKAEALAAHRQRQQKSHQRGADEDAGADAPEPASTPDDTQAAAQAEAEEAASTPAGDAADPAPEADPDPAAKPKSSVWRQLPLAAQMYLTDRAEYELQFHALAKAEGVAWTGYNDAVKAEAKKVKQARAEAEKAAQEAARHARREENRQVRESVGAPHLEGGKAPDVAQALERHYMALTGAAHAFDQGALWTYAEESGLWRELYAEAVHDFLQRQWHGVATTGAELKPWECVHWRGIEEAFRARASGHGQGRGFFDAAPNGLAFRDCFLTVEADGTLTRQPKSPKWRARHGFDFDLPDIEDAWYRPMFWADYLDSAVPDDTGQALLGEVLGVALLGAAPQFQKATLILGPGGSGKSVFLEVAADVAKRIGPTACTSISPHHWRDGHYLAGLVGSRLNILDENEAKDFACPAFKAVVTAGNLTANPKGLPNFQFKPRAGHIFASNHEDLPGVPDAGPAFWRRWQCVPFNRVFSGMSDEKAALAARIIDRELPRVVAWALRLAEQALKRQAYTRHLPGEAALAEWRGEASPVQQFLDERAMRHEGPAIQGDLLTDVFKSFRAWCEEYGYGVPNKNTFTKRLAACGYPRLRSTGTRVGLKLLPAGQTVDQWYNDNAN
jgi:P4 family phage/plasmid primase-like protien